jgi:F-type H+-transporting ATPase subunit gamma
MTERLSDISAHIHGVDQLRSVIGAMRAIAAARAQQSRVLLPGIRAYADVVAQAIAQAVRLMPEDHATRSNARPVRAGLVLFTAEQGFAGAFSDRMLEAAGPRLSNADVFLVGTRGAMLADEQGVRTAWRTGMALHSDGAALVAARICEVLYERVPQAGFDRVDLIFPAWVPGTGLAPQVRSLLPLDTRAFADLPLADAPLTTLPPTMLLDRLAEEYVYAQLCDATTEAFVAENEARVASMAAAKNNIERMLLELQAQERQVRQEDITAEVVELAAAFAKVGAGLRTASRHSAR